MQIKNQTTCVYRFSKHDDFLDGKSPTELTFTFIGDIPSSKNQKPNKKDDRIPRKYGRSPTPIFYVSYKSWWSFYDLVRLKETFRIIYQFRNSWYTRNSVKKVLQ